MNSFSKGLSTSKYTSLNPNAAEFVPLSLRAASSTGKNSDAPKLETAESGGKAILNRTESTTSNTSDDETHQYWRYRLPDDITPDFGEDFFKDSENFLSGTSAGLNYSSSSKPGNVIESGKLTYEQLDCVNGKSRYVFSELGEGRYTSGISASGAWDQQFAGHECDVGFVNELVGEQAYTDNNDVNPVELLATVFPGFAAESLADIYYASGGDLSLTMEMLTQLELQDDTGSHQSFNTKSSSAPNLMGMDFPALSSAEMLNGLSHYTEDETQQAVNTYRRGGGDKLFFSGSGNSISATDFAAVVRKNASEHLGQWKYDRNSSMDINVGSNRNSQVTAGSFAANNRTVNGDRVRGSTNVRQTPQLWLETGEAVGNMYADLREEARDHARVRNTYFEQARQAYLVGNKAQARELSAKGQWHNGLMKAAHEKAGEAIYRQRNQVTGHLQNYLPGQERLIDLHGLHVNEAIHVLKAELTALRNTARSSGQRQQVLICVGTGHHTKGSRTPARLPIAIEKHLLEEEHLDYSEPQPGMLRVAIY